MPDWNSKSTSHRITSFEMLRKLTRVFCLLWTRRHVSYNTCFHVAILWSRVGNRFSLYITVTTQQRHHVFKRVGVLTCFSFLLFHDNITCWWHKWKTKSWHTVARLSPIIFSKILLVFCTQMALQEAALHSVPLYRHCTVQKLCTHTVLTRPWHAIFMQKPLVFFNNLIF